MFRNRARVLAILAIWATFGSCSQATTARSHERELSFQLINENLIVVQGSINAENHLNLVLDTGATCTLLNSELARRKGLYGKNTTVTAMEGPSSAEIVNVAEIRVGEFHALDHRALVTNLQGLRTKDGASVAAIIGLDVLKSSNFLVDFKKRVLVFNPLTQGKHHAAFIVTEPFLTVSANVEGQQMRLLVDSGTPRLLLFRNRVDPEHCRMQPVAAGTTPTMVTSTGTVSAHWFRASHVALGEVSLQEQLLLVADTADFNGQIDGLLGLAQTGFQKVWFDFAERMMAWE